MDDFLFGHIFPFHSWRRENIQKYETAAHARKKKPGAGGEWGQAPREANKKNIELAPSLFLFPQAGLVFRGGRRRKARFFMLEFRMA
jgi:hypothetical protein